MLHCCSYRYYLCHGYILFKHKRWQEPVRNIKQARGVRSMSDSSGGLTIALADKHTGRGRCRQIPTGELPINTRAFSLTWQLAPDKDTETERVQKQTHFSWKVATERMPLHYKRSCFIQSVFSLFLTNFFLLFLEWIDTLVFTFFTRLSWIIMLRRRSREYKYNKEIEDCFTVNKIKIK